MSFLYIYSNGDGDASSLMKVPSPHWRTEILKIFCIICIILIIILKSKPSWKVCLKTKANIAIIFLAILCSIKTIILPTLHKKYFFKQVFHQGYLLSMSTNPPITPHLSTFSEEILYEKLRNPPLWNVFSLWLTVF